MFSVGPILEDRSSDVEGKKFDVNLFVLVIDKVSEIKLRALLLLTFVLT